MLNNYRDGLCNVVIAGDQIFTVRIGEGAARKLSRTEHSQLLTGYAGQGSISKSAFTVEEEAHCPDLLLRQRPFGPDLLADIPRNSFLPRWIVLRVFQDNFPGP